MITYKDIISRIDIPSNTLRRASVDPSAWSMRDMMDVVRTIGRSIDPRFVIDEHNREVYEAMVYWVMGDSRMRCISPLTGDVIKGRLDRGIYLAGTVGSGKTVAMQVLKELYVLNPFKINNSRLLWTEWRADDLTDAFAQSGDLSRYKKNFFLCIQDLGAEPALTQYMGNKLNVIGNVMEYRGDRRDTVTLVTSNIPLGHPDLRERYGLRAASRMAEMMNYLILVGDDRREDF